MWLDFVQKAQDMLLIHNPTCPLYITAVMDGQVSVRTRQHVLNRKGAREQEIKMGDCFTIRADFHR